MFLLAIMDPSIFKYTRFNSYPTEYQKELLNRLSRERNCPKTELLREALHYFLRDNGLDDGLSYDWKDHEKQMAKIFPWCKEKEKEKEEERRKKEEEEMEREELRRFLIEQHKRDTNM